MDLPRIDLSTLPDLATLTGLYGSLAASAPRHDDSIVVIATVVYESGLA